MQQHSHHRLAFTIVIFPSARIACWPAYPRKSFGLCIQTTSHTQNWLGWPVLLLKFQQPPKNHSTAGVIKRENTLLSLHRVNYCTCFPVYRYFLAHTYGSNKNAITDSVRNCSYISDFLIDPFRRSFFTQLLPKLVWTNLDCYLIDLMRLLWPPTMARALPKLSVSVQSPNMHGQDPAGALWTPRQVHRDHSGKLKGPWGFYGLKTLLFVWRGVGNTSPYWTGTKHVFSVVGPSPVLEPGVL